jgi:hypothetical protein
MQTISRTARRNAGGYALTLTIILAGVMLMVFASMLLWVSSNSTVTLRNNQFNMSQAAAEAATERVLSQMDRDFISQSISNASVYQSLPGTISQSGWPIQYEFGDGTNYNGSIVVSLGTPTTNTVPLNSQYTGLYGLEQDCTLIAFATPTNQPQNVPAEIIEAVQFASIPLFQFAIFYNINMEICPGSAMTINGPVYCNQSIWEGSDNATFSSTVTAVGTNDTLNIDPFATDYSPQTAGAHFLPGQPVHGADALTLPIAGATNNNPTNVEQILNLPPQAYAMGSSAAYYGGGTNFLANEADIYVTNSPSGTNSGSASWIPSGTNTFVYFQDSALTLMPPDFYILKTPAGRTTNSVLSSTGSIDSYTNVQYAGYSFLTNVVFYDWREGGNNGAGPAKKVQAVQIDVAKFGTWVTAATGANADDVTKVSHSGHHIDSVYIYNAVTNTSTILPAVRVVNGQQLPTPGSQTKGFTVATAMPLYVLGDYNIQQTSGGSTSRGTNNGTQYTYPAALMADAVTILSTNWSDSIVTEKPAAGDTTVNAACLEGIVPSNPAIATNYSGGVENFLRLLEDWSSTVSGHSGAAILTYHGSIIVMFPSIYATNSWNGNYYGVPQRSWSFDTNYMLQAGLPPLTPQNKAMIRGQWTAQ